MAVGSRNDNWNGNLGFNGVRDDKNRREEMNKYGCPACGSLGSKRAGNYLLVFPRFFCNSCGTFWYLKSGRKNVCLINK